MIKLKSVSIKLGSCILTFEYTDSTKQVKTIEINRSEITDRLRKLKALVGRELTMLDLKLIILRLFGEVREGQQPLLEDFDYSPYIGLDLEA